MKSLDFGPWKKN